MSLLLLDGLKPFSMLAGFIVLLLLAELALMLAGLSSAIETDAADAPAPDGWPDTPEAVDPGAVLSEDEIALLDLPPTTHRPPTGRPPLISRTLRAIGYGRSPLLVWLTCLATGLSALGYALQLTVLAASGAMFPGGLALGIVLVPGLVLGGRLAAVVARVIPSFESHAISGQTYHGRRGEVVIGTARRGEPAQVRWRDLYGTTHSLMAEPLRDIDQIEAGTEVLIVKTRDRQPRVVSLRLE